MEKECVCGRREVRGELGRVDGGDTVVGLYCLREESSFNFKNLRFLFHVYTFISFKKFLNFPQKKRTMRILKTSRTGMLSVRSSAVLKSVVSYTLKNPMRYRVIFLLFYFSENRQCVKCRAMKNKVNQVFDKSQFCQTL